MSSEPSREISRTADGIFSKVSFLVVIEMLQSPWRSEDAVCKTGPGSKDTFWPLAAPGERTPQALTSSPHCPLVPASAAVSALAFHVVLPPRKGLSWTHWVPLTCVQNREMVVIASITRHLGRSWHCAQYFRSMISPIP